MCPRIGLTPVRLPEQPFGEFLRQLGQTHDHGGALIAAFDVSPSAIFDWFASRNRLTDEGLIDLLVAHPVIRETLGDLGIPSSNVETGLTLSNPFLLDSRFAYALHTGGAYWHSKGDGSRARKFAIDVCNAMFGLRYGEVSVYESTAAWTPWFKGIAWDRTEVVYDRRLRRLWVFALTDTD